MKVLQIVTQLERAGAQTLSYWLEQMLSDEFDVITLFLYNKSGSDLFPDDRALAGARPSKVSSWASVFQQLVSKLRTSKSDVALAHTHFAIAACVLAAPFARFPKIVAVHHWPIEKYPLICRWIIKLGDASRIIRQHVYVSDSIAPSNSDLVITNPVPGRFTAEDIGQNAQADLLIVARHSVEKSIDTAICALAKLPGRHLSLVGTGNLSDDLRQVANRLGVEDRIAFLGPLPNPKVRELIAGCNVLVLPSKWEAMPIVLLEGLSGDATMVVSDIAAHAFLIDCGAALAFHTGSPDSLARAISEAEGERNRTSAALARLELQSSMSESATIEKWRRTLAGLSHKVTVKLGDTPQ